MFPFPNPSLQSGTRTCNAFRAKNLASSHEAVAWVWKLPYGRNSDRSNFGLVITEGRGTCSGKHALLAQLASDLGVDIPLVVGIFLMNRTNTPEIADILQEYAVTEIPEAHCFLKYAQSRWDFTRYEEANSPLASHEFVYEEAIQPGQIGEYKTRLHKEWIRKWIAVNASPVHVPFDRFWEAREKCIQQFEAAWQNHLE